MAPKAGGAEKKLVDETESVARLCFQADVPVSPDGQPTDIDPDTQRLRLAVFSWADFSERGFSVQRISLYTQRMAQLALEERIAAKVAKSKPVDGFAIAGVSIAVVEEINQIHRENGTAAFEVLERPVASSAAHAEIYAVDGCKHAEFLKLRVKLQTAFGELQPLDVLAAE